MYEVGLYKHFVILVVLSMFHVVALGKKCFNSVTFNTIKQVDIFCFILSGPDYLT